MFKNSINQPQIHRICAGFVTEFDSCHYFFDSCNSNINLNQDKADLKVRINKLKQMWQEKNWKKGLNQMSEPLFFVTTLRKLLTIILMTLNWNAGSFHFLNSEIKKKFVMPIFWQLSLNYIFGSCKFWYCDSSNTN